MIVGLGLVAGTCPQVNAAEHDPWSVEPIHAELGVFGGVVLPPADHELYDASSTVPQRPLQEANGTVGARLAFYPSSAFGLEAEGSITFARLRQGGDDALLYRFGGHIVLQYPARFSVFALGGLGAYGVLSEVDVQGDDIDLAAHWGVGAKFFVSENFGLRVDGRQILTGWAEQGAEDGQTSLHYEVLGGLVFTFGRHAGPPEDQDDDGIPDPNDKCPNRIGVRPDGCPPQDTDGDGVADPKDRCPTVKARSSDGCPVDTDQDGVPDSQDKCPSTAAKTTHGCPDSDDDGVPDDRDKCPTTSAQTTSGCPDSDNDGVLDDQDACADVAGTLATGCPDPDPDKDGIDTNQDRCPFDAGRPPDGCPEDVQELLGAVRGVTFRSGGAKLRSTSITVLTRAFSVLQAHPSLKLEIRGHTDSAGNADANLRLSQLRANVVRAYLIDLGVDRNRLTAVGFGEALPIKNNRTRAGRAANRRIEFKLIE